MVPVSRSRHWSQYWHKPSNWAFARQEQFIPVAIRDVVSVASAIPIVFMQKNNVFAPVALMRLNSPYSSFIGANGEWRASVEVPRLRSYPFDVTETGKEEFSLCIHQDSNLGTNETEAYSFFDENGAMSAALKEIAALCRRHVDTNRTIMTATLPLKELGLFKSFEHAENSGIFVLDAHRIATLCAQDICTLYKSGSLPLIYAHLVSQQHVSWLTKAEALMISQQIIDSNDQKGASSSEIVTDFLSAMAHNSTQEEIDFDNLRNLK